jgi:glycosyltransferase involved in cell wall biosynthesis
MRVLLTSNSRYPASRGGNGSSRVHDALAKGLAEMGHKVLYWVKDGIGGALPRGVTAVERCRVDADIYHFNKVPSEDEVPPGKPWLRTYHAACDWTSFRKAAMTDNVVFVSRAHAESFGWTRYVWNGVDPSELTYSETKDDYFVFIVSHLWRGRDKGLGIAIAIAEHFGTRLIVGAALDDFMPDSLRSPNVEYRGLIDGVEKAELLAGARALLFPTQVTEPFGLVIAEALFSGTPVIASSKGACPELVTSDVGFTCDTIEDYLAAVTALPAIRPADCRRRAMAEFDYRVMTRHYLAEYGCELGRSGKSNFLKTTG